VVSVSLRCLDMLLHRAGSLTGAGAPETISPGAASAAGRPDCIDF
jgi:hypothetical protein